MNTLTRKELVALNAAFPFYRRGLGSCVMYKNQDTALLEGMVYTHEANDYRNGHGNHSDSQLFRVKKKLVATCSNRQSPLAY